MLPTGKPDYMFSFPEKCTGFDAEDRHINVTEEALIEVGVLAELDEIESDFLSEEEGQRFSCYLPDPEDIECKDLVDAFTFLKNSLETPLNYYL